jgi:saccharopine dehydrogenase-like NADP-dependent oxidoreductase
MKKVLVIGGAGAMGQVIVRDLLDGQDLAVVIADFDEAKAQKMAQSLSSQVGKSSGQINDNKGAKISGIYTDITNHDVMVKSMTGADLVINSTPYYHNVGVMEACLAAGCHYIDLGGLFHVSKEQLKLNQRFKEAKLTAVLGMGAAPGMTNIMAAAGQTELDSVESIDIYVGSIDNTVFEHPFPIPYSIETLIDEYTLSPMVYEGGEFKSVPALSGAVQVDFPQPVGTQEAIYTLHSEVLTLPATYENKGIKGTTFRLGLPMEFHDKLKFLMSLGFGTKEKVSTADGAISPRKMLAAMLAKFPIPEVEPDDCEVVRVDVAGLRAGRKTLVRLETTVYSDKRWQVSCGALDTGVPPSIVAQMIMSGAIKETGVLPPEVAVDPQPFFQELAKRNIIMRKISEEVLVSPEVGKVLLQSK